MCVIVTLNAELHSMILEGLPWLVITLRTLALYCRGEQLIDLCHRLCLDISGEMRTFLVA